MLHWARRTDLALCCARPIRNEQLALNPIERRVIDPVMRRSRDARARLSAVNGTVEVSCLVLDALGNNLGGGSRPKLIGAPSIAIVFFENTMFDAAGHERARRYPLIVTGSTWNREVLRDPGHRPGANSDPRRRHDPFSSRSARGPVWRPLRRLLRRQVGAAQGAGSCGAGISRLRATPLRCTAGHGVGLALAATCANGRAKPVYQPDTVSL